MSYVYIKSEPRLWTVGFYDPAGKWQPESDHGTADDAAARVRWMNGGADAQADYDPAEAIREAGDAVRSRGRWDYCESDDPGPYCIMDIPDYEGPDARAEAVCVAEGLTEADARQIILDRADLAACREALAVCRRVLTWVREAEQSVVVVSNALAAIDRLSAATEPGVRE